MKVAFIHSQCENGGISRIVFSICGLLEKEGNTGKFAFGRGFIPEGKEDCCYKFGNKLGIYYHVLLSRLFDMHGKGSIYDTRKLLKWIEQEKPDIIHMNNVHGYYLNLNLFFSYLNEKKIPVVWTLHDCWNMTGHCSHFIEAGCEKWKTGCEKCPQISVYPSSWYVDRSKKNYIEKKLLFESLENVTFVVPSKWLLGIACASFLKDKNIRVINNGIDIEKFKITNSDVKQKYQIENKKVVLAVASVWTAKKGLNDIIKLSEIIDKSRYEIVMIGVTSTQSEELEKKGIKCILHTKNVEELCEWYSTADVFINPTYEDTYPTVNLEAIACGTPVITYRTGGSVEVIEPDTGLIVDVGDVNGLNKAICKVVKNTEACRKKAEEFDYNLKFAEYISLYNEILEDKRG